MALLNPFWYPVFVWGHVIAVLIGVATVTCTDLLHIIGLRNRRTEKKVFAYIPTASTIIIFALSIIVFTGFVLALNRPELFSNTLFLLKAALVGILILNGFLLHYKAFPAMEKCIKSIKTCCDKEQLQLTTIAGSISIVSWYAILILALTKSLGYYDYPTYFFLYVGSIVVVYSVAFYMEKKMRKCRF